MFITVALLAAVLANAQPMVNVSGKVSSQLWVPVADAVVSVKGEDRGVLTDINGNYSIQAMIGQTLVFSLPGYTTKESKIEGERLDATINLSVKSVRVNEDNTVTFTYVAPKARTVQVAGNFFRLPNGTYGEGVASMSQTSDGLWTYTTVPVISELYRYEFIVDGNYTIDASAPYTIRDGEVLRNVFVVNGETGDLTMVQDVPHGTVSKVWYHSDAPGESSLGYDKAKTGRWSVRTAPNAYEASFMEIVNFIDKTYRTKADRNHRAICGLSMGGGHTSVISANFPDKFGYVGLFSAAVNLGSDNAQSEMMTDFKAKLGRLFSYKPFYYISIGDEDFLYQANKSYREFLDSMGYRYTYVETDCGHVWKNWRHYLADFAPLLFK